MLRCYSWLRIQEAVLGGRGGGGERAVPGTKPRPLAYKACAQSIELFAILYRAVFKAASLRRLVLYAVSVNLGLQRTLVWLFFKWINESQEWSFGCFCFVIILF